MATREILLADADVLIDYRDSDLAILRLVSDHIGRLRVLREILAEAVNITERRCAQLNIEVVDLETTLMLKVNTMPSSLSVNDRLCVIACEHHGWTCVTNDGPLRRVCKSHGVPVRRGLGLMIDLVQSGTLTEARALRVAKLIRKANPTHITEALLDEFGNQLKLKRS
jgi:predicted nucleic acid-binding protein